MVRGNRCLRRANLKGRPLATGLGRLQVGFAIKALFTVLIAVLNLDDADVEPRIAIGCERQDAGNIDRADRRIALDIVEHPIAAPNQHPRSWPPVAFRHPMSLRPTKRRSPPSERLAEGRCLRVRQLVAANGREAAIRSKLPLLQSQRTADYDDNCAFDAPSLEDFAAEMEAATGGPGSAMRLF